MTSWSGVLIGRSGERCCQISDGALLRLLHAPNHLLAGDAAGEIIGIGEKAALGRYFLDVAG